MQRGQSLLLRHLGQVRSTRPDPPLARHDTTRNTTRPAARGTHAPFVGGRSVCACSGPLRRARPTARRSAPTPATRSPPAQVRPPAPHHYWYGGPAVSWLTPHRVLGLGLVLVLVHTGCSDQTQRECVCGKLRECCSMGTHIAGRGERPYGARLFLLRVADVGRVCASAWSDRCVAMLISSCGGVGKSLCPTHHTAHALTHALASRIAHTASPSASHVPPSSTPSVSVSPSFVPPSATPSVTPTTSVTPSPSPSFITPSLSSTPHAGNATGSGYCAAPPHENRDRAGHTH